MHYLIMSTIIGWAVAGYYGYQTYKMRKSVAKLIRDTLDTMKRIEAEEDARLNRFLREHDRGLN